MNRLLTWTYAISISAVLGGGPLAAQEDPNLLMADAINLYTSALDASGEERAGLLRSVEEILTRIETQYPDSVPATFMREGRRLGPIDQELISSELTPSPGQLAARLSGDLAEKWSFLKERSPDVAEVVENTLQEVIGATDDEIREELFVKASYYTMAAFYYVTDTSFAQYFDPTEAGELYKAFVTEGGLDRLQGIGIETAESIAMGVALEFASTTVADLVIDAAPQLSSSYETIARAAIKASITEVLLAFQAYKDPSKVPGLIAKRVTDLIEIMATTKGLAADVDRTLAATAMEMQTLAQITASYREQDGTQNAIDATRVNLEERVFLAVGRDDAKAVSDIFLLGWAALTAEFEGDFANAKRRHDVLKERGAAGNIPTIWNAPDLLTYLANGFEDSPRRAAEFMIGLTELSKYSGNDPVEDGGYSTSNSTSALPGDLQGAQIAPDGFLGPPTGADPATATATGSSPLSWEASDALTGLAVGEPQLGVELRADNSVLVFDRQALTPLFGPGSSSLSRVRSSPGGNYRVIIQEITLRDQETVPRLGIVPQDVTRPTIVLTPDDGSWFSGDLSWSSDGQFAIAQQIINERKSQGVLINLLTGVRYEIPSDRPASENSHVVVHSARFLRNRIHAIDFVHYSCSQESEICVPATSEDTTQTVVSFRLPANAEYASTDALPSEAPSQVRLFEALPDGLYSTKPEVCMRQNEAVVETVDTDFRLLKRPRVGLFDVGCSIVSVTEANNAATITSSCTAEGHVEDRVFRWQITGPRSFIEQTAHDGQKEYQLCEAATATAQVPGARSANAIATTAPVGRAPLSVSAGFFDPSYAAAVDPPAQHLGVDLPAPAGGEVVSPVTGVVIANHTDLAENWEKFLVIADNSTDARHVFGHIVSGLQPGTPVDVGEPIGTVVAAGTGPHVHWGINTRAVPISTIEGWGWGRAPASTTQQEALDRGWVDPTTWFAERQNESSESAEPMSARPEPQESQWTEAIVAPEDIPYECFLNTTPECLAAAGATPESIEFVSQRLAGVGGNGAVLPVNFKELGQVDVAYLQFSNAAGTIYPHLVNTSPESIVLPMFPHQDLSRAAQRGDPAARSVLRQYPEASGWRPVLLGMRMLPNGHQRFSLVMPYTESCRACSYVAYGVNVVDYDQTGRLRSFESRGVFDVRRLRPNWNTQFTAADAQRVPALIQYLLSIRGYDAGPLDGVIGPRTRSALAEFQRENNVSDGSGRVDHATLSALVSQGTMFSNGTKGLTTSDQQASADAGALSGSGSSSERNHQLQPSRSDGAIETQEVQQAGLDPFVYSSWMFQADLINWGFDGKVRWNNPNLPGQYDDFDRERFRNLAERSLEEEVSVRRGLAPTEFYFERVPVGFHGYNFESNMVSLRAPSSYMAVGEARYYFRPSNGLRLTFIPPAKGEYAGITMGCMGWPTMKVPDDFTDRADRGYLKAGIFNQCLWARVSPDLAESIKTLSERGSLIMQFGCPIEGFSRSRRGSGVNIVCQMTNVQVLDGATMERLLEF